LHTATFTGWASASLIAARLAALLAAGQPLAAQAVRAPIFAIEPGVVTLNAVSSTLNTGASTGLNLRFVAEFPTRIPWLTARVGTSFAPLGLSNGMREFNEPAFFYGPVIMLLPRDRTANWIELTLPLLGTYRLDESGEAERLYVHDVAIQGGFTIPIGDQLLRDMGGTWRRASLYGLIEQNLTPGRNFTTQRVDRFSPMFYYGVSIPLGRTSEPRDEP
jgi:hypothetical protein